MARKKKMTEQTDTPVEIVTKPQYSTIDELTAKVEQLGVVAHLFYVRKLQAEILELLNKLKQQG